MLLSLSLSLSLSYVWLPLIPIRRGRSDSWSLSFKFFLQTYLLPYRNKLECLPLPFTYTWAYQSGASYGTPLSCLAPGLARKYYTRVEVNGSGKYSSLLSYGNNCFSKTFYSTAHWGLYYKTFYDRNLPRVTVAPWQSIATALKWRPSKRHSTSCYAECRYTECHGAIYCHSFPPLSNILGQGQEFTH